ncbi:hypothetical protein PA27867_3345 [Cryobacterium arcticum]|uniref:Uncharacterized protein n=1 Tax=Cryobacterium arcticum TaxID=670052 RepID=A0A1B1BNW6_9MICO|nr:hypothetical protein PA27867_3345 [Cryobacterium arcticum]
MVLSEFHAAVLTTAPDRRCAARQTVRKNPYGASRVALLHLYAAPARCGGIDPSVIIRSRA